MSNEQTPMTTRSRERREAVAAAIHYYRGEWEFTYEDDINRVPVPFADSAFRGIALAQADAALAAALPDRKAFRKQVESIIEARFRFADDPCELWEGEWMQRWHDMEVMVYGDSDVWDHYFEPNADDAQAGEVE